MARTSIYLPAGALFPRRLPVVVKMLKDAGFDGVEVLLGSSVNHTHVRSVVDSAGLGLHWHELWSLEDNSAHWFNRVAAYLGWIPRMTQHIRVQLPLSDREPIVCYAHRVKEFTRYVRPFAPDLWFQTCKVGSRKIDFYEFVAIVAGYKLPVVFDTQHVLEWTAGCSGVDELGKHSVPALHRLLAHAWDALGPYVREIHFNNFRPEWGPNNGRNVMPEEGVLDLRSFARFVTSHGWHGVVTPEVAPGHLFSVKVPFMPLGIPIAPRLRELHDTVRDMFP